MTLFCFVLIDFAYHYIRRHPVKPFRFRKANRGSQGFIATENIIPSAERSGRLMVIAIIISTFCVYVRSVYRDIELFDGVCALLSWVHFHKLNYFHSGKAL